jgi:hypothetical protein
MGTALNMVATDFVLGLELAALDAGNRRVQAQRVVDHVDLAVVFHLVDGFRIAQIGAAQFLHIVVQRLVGAVVAPCRSGC